MSPSTSRQRGWPLFIKQLADRSLAAAALWVTAPVIAATALGVLKTMGRPVLFVQQRPGKNGRPFFLVKFRTMRNARGEDGRVLPDAERMTPFGRWLRSTSLDELPQLWNVLRGELSWVGPRPLLMQYLERYDTEQSRRHEVLPGLTGWAQVNGRNAISWDEKFSLDVWYVDHWSLLLDAKIVAMTVLRVFQRSDVSQEGHVTMPEFMGSGSRERTRL